MVVRGVGAASPAPPDDLADWCRRLPKAELHLHLEGAIPLDALWVLVEKYGGDPEVPHRAALEARFAYRDFRHFLATWRWKNGFLRQAEDFSWAAAAVAAELASQNIRYAEAFFSPTDFAAAGLSPGRLAEALRSGLERVPEVEVALIADLVRDGGPERAARTLEEVAELAGLGVIGIGLGGSEDCCPPEPFAAVYRRARHLGLHTTAHAGEAAGPASIWGALGALEVERIGHGVRAVEDPALIERLAATRIPLEVCPTSNVRTGVAASLASHPIGALMAAGLVVTVNTDDPSMFGCSLAGELAGLGARLGLDRMALRGLIAAALEAAWLPEARRAALAAEFACQPAWSEIGSASEAARPAPPRLERNPC